MSDVVAEITQVPSVDSEAVSHDAVVTTPEPEALVEADLLVEDISIDGMCGVY